MAINQWTNAMWYIHEMEGYSLLKRNEGLRILTSTNPEMPCWLEKKKKNKGHIVYDSLYKMSRKGRSIVTECRLSHCQGLGV